LWAPQKNRHFWRARQRKLLILIGLVFEKTRFFEVPLQGV
jgi:hypothetical protein